MANLNKSLLIGRLTRDPELKYTTSQTAVLDFSLAVNRQWNKDGQRQSEVTFVDCRAFGRTAENINKYLHKGSEVFIEGRLQKDQWTAKDGGKRSKTLVVVGTCQFLGGKESGNGGTGQDSKQQRRSGSVADRQPAPATPSTSAATSPEQKPWDEHDGDKDNSGGDDIPF